MGQAWICRYGPNLELSVLLQVNESVPWAVGAFLEEADGLLLILRLVHRLLKDLSVALHPPAQLNANMDTHGEERGHCCLGTAVQLPWLRPTPAPMTVQPKFEDDMSYWTSLGRGGSEYYGGYYQHHYDEDSPIGPRNPHTFRHGAGVNYDDY
ncbi:hypothetical protein ASZ78_008215 [Callipepla squamata]|uniref:Uncharacterized protein n=1 Tax=Callipepla squamata TaxID=9009 RepID=A0A226NG45_CALSU|nr:hypothetical protein ASZ78_008215 [Callipepla squamata]